MTEPREVEVVKSDIERLLDAIRSAQSLAVELIFGDEVGMSLDCLAVVREKVIEALPLARRLSTELSRLRAIERAARDHHEFWQHHPQCQPMTKAGCTCGLWLLTSLLSPEGERPE